MIRILATVAVTWGITSSELLAHYDVNATVAALTKKIKTQPSAELFHDRAIEFRALRDRTHAEADLKSALKLNPDFLPALAALARIQNQKGDHQNALGTAQRLGTLSPDPHHQLLLADIAYDAGEKALALAAIKKAPASEDTTHLLHAHLLFEKSQIKEAAAVLKNAHANSQSIVLRNAWLDAATFSPEHFEEILPILSEEINSSRFSASHRIRRARLIQHLDNDSGFKRFAKEDLNAALVEINSRLNPERPDLTLINDRRKAYLLLGENDKASNDLGRMKKAGLVPVGPWLLRSIVVNAR